MNKSGEMSATFMPLGAVIQSFGHERGSVKTHARDVAARVEVGDQPRSNRISALDCERHNAGPFALAHQTHSGGGRHFSAFANRFRCPRIRQVVEQ